MVCLKNKEGKEYIFNMKEDILNYYGKQRISTNIYNIFLDDANSEKITFYMDDNSYSIK